MALGLAPAVANAWLDALGNATNYTAPLAFWMKLHVGDPGVAGTTNPAVETTRKQVSFGVAASGLISNDVAVTWTNVAGSEDYTHWSAHDASTAGNFLCSGLMTANAVTAADNFEIPIGDVDLDLNVAA